MWSQDFRYAARLLAGTPAFTAVALLTLALGVGANAAIFSIIDHVLLRPAPVRDIDRLAVVWETDRNTGTTREPASLPDYLDFRERARQVEQLASFTGTEVNFTPERGEPAPVCRPGEHQAQAKRHVEQQVRHQVAARGGLEAQALEHDGQTAFAER